MTWPGIEPQVSQAIGKHSTHLAIVLKQMIINIR